MLEMDPFFSEAELTWWALSLWRTQELGPGVPAFFNSFPIQY